MYTGLLTAARRGAARRGVLGAAARLVLLVARRGAAHAAALRCRRLVRRSAAARHFGAWRREYRINTDADAHWRRRLLGAALPRWWRHAAADASTQTHTDTRRSAEARDAATQPQGDGRRLQPRRHVRAHEISAAKQTFTCC